MHIIRDTAMKETLYIDREDFRLVEREEQGKFVRSILLEMDVPIDDCWPEEEYELSVDSRIRLRHVLNMFDINIIDDKDGGIKIYVSKEIVAEWKKCTFDFKLDNKEIDPTKKIYYQMNIEFWSLFDEQE